MYRGIIRPDDLRPARTPHKLRVGWDFDGVGYYFGESVLKFMSSVGLEVPEDRRVITHYDFYTSWGLTMEEFDSIVDQGVDAGIIFGPGDDLTRPNFFDALKQSKDSGHTNVAITHRWQGSPGRSEENTRRWLEPVMEYIDELHFSGDKTCVPTDIFVEDNADNCEALLLNDTPCYLIDRPWNEHARHLDYWRISDVSEYPKMINSWSTNPVA